MHTMRRADRQLTEKEAFEILNKAEYGTLSTVGPDGEPYGVPLTFAVEPDATAPAGVNLVFHVAVEGRKLLNLEAHPEAHFVAVAQTRVLPEEFSIEYQSVMVQGTVERIMDRNEKIAILLRITDKYAPVFRKEAEAYADRAVDRTVILRLRGTAFSGKQLKESGKPGMGKS